MCPINTVPLRKAVASVSQLAEWGKLCTGREMPWLRRPGCLLAQKGCPAAKELDIKELDNTSEESPVLGTVPSTASTKKLPKCAWLPSINGPL